jgi:hypothetical protein
MRLRLSVVNLLLASPVTLLWSTPALACRCAPQSLEHYFERADVVMVARATSTRVVAGAPGHLEVELAPIAPVYKGDPQSIATFATTLSTASCGVPVEAGQTFLIFAARDDRAGRTAWFDTCNGTRRFGPDVTVADFVDTPAEKIILRLEGLHVANAVRDPRGTPDGPRLPKPGHPGAELLGLLELPTVLNLDEPGASSPPPRLPQPPVEVRSAPADGAALLGAIRSAADVVTRESDYERKAAVVLEQRPGWYRIALPNDRSGWLRAAGAGRFHPLSELIVNRLNYLTGHWDGWVWPDPGAGHPVRSDRKRREGRQEYPANVVAVEEIGGTLWLRVELLSADPCDGGSPTVVSGGWVPAYSPEGKLTAWFHARGC